MVPCPVQSSKLGLAPPFVRVFERLDLNDSPVQLPSIGMHADLALRATLQRGRREAKGARVTSWW